MIIIAIIAVLVLLVATRMYKRCNSFESVAKISDLQGFKNLGGLDLRPNPRSAMSF